MEAHGPVGLVMTQPRFENSNPQGVFSPVFVSGYCFFLIQISSLVFSGIERNLSFVLKILYVYIIEKPIVESVNPSAPYLSLVCVNSRSHYLPPASVNPRPPSYPYYTVSSYA